MRVVSSELDPHKTDSDVSGTHTVLYPTSDADVKEALVVAKVLGIQQVLVRSGRHAANNEHVDGTGAMVVNLRNYAGIEIDSNNNVTVCAGATTSDLAAKLKEKNLFLPLDGNCGKSVFANARSTEPGIVPAFNLGSFLTGSQGINRGNLELFDNVLNQSSDEHIVTKMVFKAQTADEVKGHRMTSLWFVYDRTFFGDVLRHVFFGESKVAVGDELDVRVTVTSGAYGIPLLKVTTKSRHDSAYMAEMLERLDPGKRLIVDASTMNDQDIPIGDAPAGRKTLLMRTDMKAGVDIVKAVADEGNGGQYVSSNRTRYSGELMEETLEAYVDAVHRAIAVGPTPTMPRVRIRSSACWKAQGGIGLVGVDVNLNAPQPNKQTLAEKTLHHDFAEAIHDRSRADPASRVDVGRQVAVGKLVGFDVGRRLDIIIPGFSGPVYSEGESGNFYTVAKDQYATSSYTGESERMTPHLIGYPRDVADVEIFVKYAIAHGKKVVVRSGGHQYSGTSSGGSDTMLLSMDAFDRLDIDPADPDTGAVMANVGPGAHLTILAEKLKEKGVTIPHGECFKVCIGGHVQTGGYGHILRSYGLALDHVKSFDIVLAHPIIESRTIQRPVDAVTEASSKDDRIFWGVMGGGAGSFGVITNVEFECIKDMDHPGSSGYSGVYRYHKDIFKAAMDKVQKRTAEAHDPDGPLPSDCDLMVSAMNAYVPGERIFDAILVEMVQGGICGSQYPPTDSNGDVTGVDRMEEEIKCIDDSRPSPALSYGPDWPPSGRPEFSPSTHTALSYMSNAFVRNKGMTSDGREFPEPYVKRVNCTTKALSDDFIASFVDLVDKAMNTTNVNFVFQMVMGGGAYEGNGAKGISSIPHRDIAIGIVFDCFYEPGGETAANDLHNEFGALVASSWGEDIRMMWGSFGKIDMSKVHEEYYGRDNGLYERLQRLKQEVDPRDHFHTPFTVQLP
ncbi:unnamed protein product, partial [Laminaria digitata]